MAQLVPVDHDPFGDAPTRDGRPYVRVGGGAQPQSPYAERIGGIESAGSGGYQAVGPETGRGKALGKYQVMPENVGPWSREILGREVTPQEFMANPQLQDQIFNGKFGQYVDKYGPEGAAKAWFAGEKGMNNPNARDVLGTTVADYAAKFNSGMSSQARQPEAQPKLVPVDHDPFASQGAPREAEGPPRAPVGMGQSVIRGINQGVNLNFGDELAGLRSASGLPDLGGGLPGVLQAGIGAARMGAEYLTGGSGASDEYTRRVEIERERNQQAQSQNPASYIAGNVTGSVALPAGGLLGAATMPARIGRGMAVGGGFGAASGAGEGEGAVDRGGRAAVGAGIGAAIGGAAVPVVDAVSALAGPAVSTIANTVRGFRNPEGEAARRVVGAIRRDADAGDLGLTAQEFQAARASGVPVANVDIGGETTRALARSAANTSPEGRGALTRMVDDRFESQGPRVAQFVRDVVGLPADAPTTRAGLKDLAKRVREPLYKKAYEDGSEGIWTSDIQRLVSSDAVTSAMQSALKKVSDENVVSGYGAMNPRITFTADGRIQFNKKPNGMPAFPDLQFWDLTRRELSDMAEAAGRGTAQNRRLGQLAKQLNTALDKAVPSYKDARGTAAKLFDVDDALEAGEQFVARGSVSEVRRAVQNMSQVERTLFAEGFTSSLIEKINKGGDRRSILNSIGNSTDARQRLEIALGPQGARELTAMLRVESVMDRMRGALGNSTTARQLMEAGLAGGSTLAYSGDPSTAATAAGAWFAIRYGGRMAGQRIDQNVARRVAEMLASNDPAVLRQGVKLVARNPAITRALRAFDDGVAKLGGVQTEKGFISLQSVGAPRAEEEQPGVGRPRGQ